VVSKTTSKGALRAMVSAANSPKPARRSSGPSGPLKKRRIARLRMLIATVAQWMAPRLASSSPICVMNLSLLGMLMPNRFLIWLTAITSAEALMKPTSTGWLMKLTRKPNRSSPMTSSISPTKKASVSANCMY